MSGNTYGSLFAPGSAATSAPKSIESPQLKPIANEGSPSRRSEIAIATSKIPVEIAHTAITYRLNAWCELSGEYLRGRCPFARVGLPPDPEGKGTDSLCLTWTPSSPHFT